MAGIVATIVTPQKPEYKGSRKVERYNLTNGSPTVQANNGAGSATGGTATITGVGGTATDGAGQITVINGTTSNAAGTIFTLTFANVLQGTAHPELWPANSAAAALGAGTWPFVQSNGSTTFQAVLPAGATLTSLGTFIWNYDVPDAVASLVITPIYIRIPDEAYPNGVQLVNQAFAVASATLGLVPNFTSAQIEIHGPN